ncbi:MAG: leucyl/phenylalanyl-tRNA--protein transferase [Myxococcota bacterium]
MGTRRDFFFPDPETADPYGLVAVTRTMSPDLLLEAYQRGIFPWSERPVRWYSPDPRAIFLLDRVQMQRSLKRTLNQNVFRVTFDRAFERVMEGCARAHERDGIWITDGFIRGYTELHRMGYAHSIEVWQDERLVGGMYGVQIRGLFAGESMFYTVSNASKVAFAHTVAQLRRLGVRLFDAQVINENTHRLGAVLVRRTDYLQLLTQAMQADVPDGRLWTPPPGPLSSIRPPSY